MIAPHQFRREVLGIAAFQLAERYRRIDVVKRGHPAGGAGDPFAHRYTVRHKRADDDEVRSRDLPLEPRPQLVEVLIEFDARLRHAGLIAIARVPVGVTLQEEYLVAMRV